MNLKQNLCMITSPIRLLVSLHALGSSTLQEVQQESMEQELQLLTSDELSKAVVHGFHLNSHLIQNGVLCTTALFMAYFAFQKIYGPKSALYKLNSIEGYPETQRKIRMAIILFFVLFFRNVENAI